MSKNNLVVKVIAKRGANKQIHNYQLDYGLVLLWEETHIYKEEVDKGLTTSDFVGIVKDFIVKLPFHVRRSETIDEFIKRYLLREIYYRFRLKRWSDLKEVAPNPIDIFEFRSAVFKGLQGRFGGLTENYTTKSVDARPWDKTRDDVFVYSLLETMTKPRNEDTKVIFVENHGRVAYIEFNTKLLDEEFVINTAKDHIMKKQ